MAPVDLFVLPFRLIYRWIFRRPAPLRVMRTPGGYRIY
jgi:hypothetical protein